MLKKNTAPDYSPSYLAIDLGASGGRHILAHRENNELVFEEVHRFPNSLVKQGNSLCWDADNLLTEIIAGLKKCGDRGIAPRSIGIDTWGVDYALLDRDGKELYPCYAYRDDRSHAYVARAEQRIPFEKLYAITGIAKMPFNTIYQLLCDKENGRLDAASFFLMLPDYFSYKLTGKIAGLSAEYTNATTTGLVNARSRDWALDLINELELPAHLFRSVREPPYLAGNLSEAVQKECGFNAEVVIIAGHDTASAVSLVPEDALYISSGTWSLLGAQTAPFLTPEAREKNWTNEGALNRNVRFLKNIMGMWILQNVRHELGDIHSYIDLENAALETGKAFSLDDDNFIVDVNGDDFLNPPSMINAIKNELSKSGKRLPETAGELSYCVHKSLALVYKKEIQNLESIAGKKWEAINIIGGGSKNKYLNSLTEYFTGKKVIPGPAEATAMGNILLQEKYFLSK
jgi:rhamnulokinase